MKFTVYVVIHQHCVTVSPFSQVRFGWGGFVWSSEQLSAKEGTLLFSGEVWPACRPISFAHTADDSPPTTKQIISRKSVTSCMHAFIFMHKQI